MGDFDMQVNGGTNPTLVDTDGIARLLDHPVVTVIAAGLVSACLMAVASGKSFGLKVEPFSLTIV